MTRANKAEEGHRNVRRGDREPEPQQVTADIARPAPEIERPQGFAAAQDRGFSLLEGGCEPSLLMVVENLVVSRVIFARDAVVDRDVARNAGGRGGAGPDFSRHSRGLAIGPRRRFDCRTRLPRVAA